MRLWPKSAHVKFLEAEHERLLAENRALVDALLKASGIAPVLSPRSDAKPPKMKQRFLPSQWRTAIEARHPEKELKREEKKDAN